MFYFFNLLFNFIFKSYMDLTLRERFNLSNFQIWKYNTLQISNGYNLINHHLLITMVGNSKYTYIDTIF